MRIRAALAGLIGLVLAPLPVQAESLTVALSTPQIGIDSNFDGAPITIFGVIERDAQTVPRGGPYEIAVLILGPLESTIARRKDRWLGVWANSASEIFLGAPSAYFVGTTDGIDDMAPVELLKRLRIGFDNIGFTYRGRVGRDNPGAAEFREAFLRIKRDEGLYWERPGSVSFIGDSIFRSTVEIPANAPIGFYSVSTFLFADGALLARSEESFRIERVGFEQMTFAFAHEEAFIYGLVCVALALFTGWLAGVIFRRD